MDFIDWTYLINYTRKWDNRARMMPSHLKWTPYYEKGKYDLAILHADQQCLVLHLGKAKLFRQLLEQIDDIPIIVINHGTPVYPEMFMQMCVLDGYGATEENSMVWAKKKMEELVKSNRNVREMVVNSHKAREQWGWGQTIIHGLDEKDWRDNVKEPRCATFISAAGIGEKYYGRNLFNETRELLKNKYGIEMIWIAQDSNFASFEEYRDFMSKTLVYFNPTIGSPMPRTRTEAMFSGCCVVSTKHQDADTFIEDGVNGFICRDDPEDAAKKIAWCIFNYKEAVEIGQRGKETALKLFSKERFQSDWRNLISKALNTKI